ncbi:hypothetical protein M495_14270 [Serratia liquefaciens ATCC 27592]|nr:hypothetical protein M495_14270 [Serratia liquefaciens ATCC 27592]
MAEVAAAEAKGFAEYTKQAEDFSEQAKSSAEEAAQSALSANENKNASVESAANAASSELAAGLSASSAAESAHNASIASNVYPSVDAAQAAITAGTIPLDALFNVTGSTNIDFVDQYKNEAGVATYTGKSYPSTEAINDAVNQVTGLVKSNTAKVDFAVVNEKGQPSVDITDGELTTSAFRVMRLDDGVLSVSDKFGRSVEVARKSDVPVLQNGNISTQAVAIESQTVPGDDGVFYADKYGRCKEISTPSDPGQENWISTTSQEMEVVGAQSRSFVNSRSVNVISFLAELIHVILYGQSLQNGTEGWPAISITQPFDNKMFGDSVMPASPTAATFTPRGGSTLNPLIATCCDASGATLTASQVSSLAPGTIAYGETPGESALNSLRRRYLDYVIKSSDPSKIFIASAAGVGGRNVAQLSKGASPNIYQRYIDAESGVSSIASSAGNSYQVGAFIYIQGENDYPFNTKSVFKASTESLFEDMQSDRITIPGDDRLSGIFMVQTGASFTVDTHDMAIGMAQIEMANELDHVFLVGGYYPYTDKNGHLDSNGYRWLGEKIAEIMFRVIFLRQDFKPLQALTSVYRGTDVLIAMHVPEPPLRIADPYVINTATNYSDYGFTAIDRISGTDTVISINSVRLVGLSTVHIELSREPVGDLIIRYADKTYHNGNGMVCDSSNGLSLNDYEYLPGSGMYASANIPDLVGKKYDLRNWSVAYQINSTEA